MQKRILSICFILILIFGFSACGENQQNGSVNFGDYEIPSDYGNQNNPENQTTKPYNTSEVLSPDTSWQKSYALSYSYYDQKTGESVLTEGRCGNYYQVSDSVSNITTLLVQEEAYMLQYMLNTSTKTGTSAVVTDGTIETSYSGFTILSTCDPYFPVYKNVTSAGSDFVANRPATRYKQTETKDNAETRIAYVWIDDQYGFASKCELYDANTEVLLMRWELTDFTTNITEEAVKIDISAYTITNE